jgi:arylsulfatase
MLLAGFHTNICSCEWRTGLSGKVKKGYKIGDETFKVHLDGVNLMPFLSGKEDKFPARVSFTG